MGYLLIAAAVFGLCFLLDKGFAKVFRGKAQHKSGLSVRQNKRYGSVGLLLVIIGIVALFAADGNTALFVGGILLILMGAGLIVYYMSFGIYYDDEGFLLENFGKKGVVYRYGDILHQQLYTVQGGSMIIELHMADGSAVQVVSTMPDFDKFLDHAFARWCAKKGLDPESCDFHDVSVGCWFPAGEVA